MNKVTHKDGYYISYNPWPSIANEGEETAIVVPNRDNDMLTKYYILIGDWREIYEKCDNLQQCLEIFMMNKDKWHSYTNTLEDNLLKS